MLLRSTALSPFGLRPFGAHRFALQSHFARTRLMGCYVMKPKPPSHDEYKTWVMMGYLGSYEHYVAVARERDMGRILIHGELGPHCSECAAPGDNLCDYPVGEGKTCDRSLCDEHAKGVASDTHYCRDHFIMWREYLASNRGYDVLDNVTPLGVVLPASRMEAREGQDSEAGLIGEADDSLTRKAGDAQTPSGSSPHISEDLL